MRKFQSNRFSNQGISQSSILWIGFGFNIPHKMSHKTIVIKFGIAIYWYPGSTRYHEDKNRTSVQIHLGYWTWFLS